MLEILFYELKPIFQTLSPILVLLLLFSVLLAFVRFVWVLWRDLQSVRQAIDEVSHLIDLSNERLKFVAEIEEIYALKERISVLESHAAFLKTR